MNLMRGIRFDANRRRRAGVALCLGAAAALVGCNQAEVRVQRVPKDADTMAAAQPSVAEPAGGNGMPAPAVPMADAQPQIHWTLPAGWTEKPLTQFRAASFNVQGTNGQVADVAVTPLPATGHEVELVNMWREQMQLPPITGTGTDPDKGTEGVPIGSETGKLFDFASDKPVIDGSLHGRMLVAMLTRGGMSWFFKMTGEESFVASQKPVFLQFLKSISFDNGGAMASASPDPHAFMGAGSPATNAASESGPAPASWTAPADWKSLPPSQFLVAKYAIDSDAGGAEVNVSLLDREGGGVLMNVNRWRGQLGLAPLDESNLPAATTTLDTPGGKAVLVDLSGTDKKSGRAHTRLLGVILPQSGRTWFYKLMGDEQVVAQQKDAFIKFVQSAKYADAP